MERRDCPYAQKAGPCPGCGGSCDCPRHALPPGTVLHSRYLIGRFLGEGGFGITYLGRDLTLMSTVAVKEYFPPDRASRDSERCLDLAGFAGGSGPLFQSGKERFLREARAMARVMRTPNIVAVQDYFEENNTAYIVMDYIDGVTFRELTEKRAGRIDSLEVLKLFRPLFPALEHMHAQGLLHRDINPENLMLSDGSVCLLDFGCARENAEGDATMTVTLRHGYAPIEQYQPSGDGQGPWTDVYGLAATIYYCLTGVAPVQAMDRLLDDSLVPPNKLGAGLTDGQERAIMRAMRVLPKRRTRSVQEFYDELYRDVDLKPKKRRRALIAGGIAAALLIAAAIPLTLRLMKSGDTPEPSETQGPPATDAILTDPEPTDEAALFSRAVAARDGSDFLALMNDELVPAIVIPEGSFVSIDRSAGPVYLDKPLVVESGAGFNCQPCMWMTSELIVEPHASLTESFLTVEGGRLVLKGCYWGSAATMSGGILDIREDSSPFFEILWIEKPADLLDPGGIAVGNDYTFGIADEFDSFSQAARVSTFEELKSAAEDDLPVVVTSPITLESGLLLTSPMQVLTGASIHTNGFRLKSQSSVTVFGEISGPLEMGDGAILYNFGSVVLDFSRDTVFQPKIMNRGKLTLAAGGLESPFLVNMGVLTVETPSDAPFELHYGNLYTFGSAEVPAGCGLKLAGGANLIADGVFTLGEGAGIESAGYIEFRGNARLYGDIESRGCVSIKSSFVLPMGGHILGGLVHVDASSGFEGYSLIGKSCAVISCRPTVYDAVRVSSTQEFLEELERGSDAPIAVYGDIEVGDLTLRRDLYLISGTFRAGDVTVVGSLLSTMGNFFDPHSVLEANSLTVLENGIVQNNDGTIRLAGDLRLDGSCAFLTSSVELSGGGIILEGGSALQNSASINGCGRLTLRDGSVFFDHFNFTPGPSTIMDVEGGTYISSRTAG